MAEERGTTMIGGVEAEIRALRQDVGGLKEGMARMEGRYEQIDKRVGNIERAVTQIQWSLVSGFLITILAVILTKLLG